MQQVIVKEAALEGDAIGTVLRTEEEQMRPQYSTVGAGEEETLYPCARFLNTC